MQSGNTLIGKGIRFLAIVMSGLIIGISVATVIEYVFGEIDFEMPPLIITAALLILLAFQTLVVHELGHVLGGKLSGFRFILLVVGPLKLSKEEGKLTVGFNRWVQMSGGLALSMPEEREATVKELIIYIAGGPIASFGAMLLFAGGAAFLNSVPDLEAGLGYAKFVTLCGALFNGGLALISTLPLPGAISDGKQVLDLLKGGQSKRAKMRLHALSAEALSGKRPCDWNSEYISRLVKLAPQMEPTDRASAYLMAYYYFEDVGDWQQSEMCINHIKAGIDESPPILKPALWLEILYVGIWHNNEIRLLAHLNKVEGPFVEKHTLARLQASILFREGKYQAAILKAEEGIELSQKITFQAGMAEAETAWMQKIIDKASKIPHSELT